MNRLILNSATKIHQSERISKNMGNYIHANKNRGYRNLADWIASVGYCFVISYLKKSDEISL